MMMYLIPVRYSEPLHMNIYETVLAVIDCSYEEFLDKKYGGVWPIVCDSGIHTGQYFRAERYDAVWRYYPETPAL